MAGKISREKLRRPNIPPTHRRVDLAHVVVVEFRDDKILAERVYWDQATVLRQVGLLILEGHDLSQRSNE